MNIDIKEQETLKETLDLSGYKYVKFGDIEFLTNKINEEKNKKKVYENIGGFLKIIIISLLLPQKTQNSNIMNFPKQQLI